MTERKENILGGVICLILAGIVWYGYQYNLHEYFDSQGQVRREMLALHKPEYLILRVRTGLVLTWALFIMGMLTLLQVIRKPQGTSKD